MNERNKLADYDSESAARERLHACETAKPRRIWWHKSKKPRTFCPGLL